MFVCGSKFNEEFGWIERVVSSEFVIKRKSKTEHKIERKTIRELAIEESFQDDDDVVKATNHSPHRCHPPSTTWSFDSSRRVSHSPSNTSPSLWHNRSRWMSPISWATAGSSALFFANTIRSYHRPSASIAVPNAAETRHLASVDRVWRIAAHPASRRGLPTLRNHFCFRFTFGIEFVLQRQFVCCVFDVDFWRREVIAMGRVFVLFVVVIVDDDGDDKF